MDDYETLHTWKSGYNVANVIFPEEMRGSEKVDEN